MNHKKCMVVERVRGSKLPPLGSLIPDGAELGKAQMKCFGTALFENSTSFCICEYHYANLQFEEQQYYRIIRGALDK